MTRTARIALPALALAAAASALAGTTAATAAPASSAVQTCNDPRTGVNFTATITGSPGSDVIWAGPGSVVAALGGDDIVFTDNADPTTIVCLGDGADWLGDSRGQGAFSQGTYFGVRGGNGPDTIRGGTGADVLLGEGGNDMIVAGPGGDVADGGAGVDQCDAESENLCEF